MALRILVVSNFFPPHTVGGAEIVAYRQARALISRGHTVVVLAGDHASDAAPVSTLGFDEFDGLPVYRLSLRSLEPDLNFYWPAAARRLTAVISTHQIEVAHFHNVMGLGANLIPAAKAAGARCFVTLHDHWGFCLRQTRLRADGSLCVNFEECAECLHAIQPPDDIALPTRLRRDYVAWCLRQADRLITPSTYLASTYSQAGIPRERITVISNGIELDTVRDVPKLPSATGVTRFLCSAYLGEHKGVMVLLEALKLLSQDPSTASRWHMTIAGEGHLRPAMEKFLRSNELSAQVDLVGRLPRHELLALLPEIDVTVLPSVWPENEPVSLLEAIASGTAQIATRLGGNFELVEPNDSGFLVAAGDAGELAAAMRRYILDPALAAKHGDFNRQRRGRFDENRSIDRLESVLSEENRALPASNRRTPVIVCGTGWPPLEANTMIKQVYKHLPPGTTAGFVWHGWADALVWSDAALLWLWDRHPEERLVNTALRHGIPVLAPASGWTEGLARHHGGVVLYNTYLEALAALRALLALPELRREIGGRSRSAAGPATALAPSSAFTLIMGQSR